MKTDLKVVVLLHPWENARGDKHQQKQRETFNEQCAEAARVVQAASIPPDPDGEIECGPGNADRSAWAALALQAFALATGADLGDCIADLIADLGHFCDRHGLDLAHEIDRAAGMYQEETSERGAQLT